MKAHHLLRHNIDLLLKERKQTRHDLAFWCRRSDAWISKIFTENADVQRNGIPLKYLDRIADFFGLATYQLFQPGISPLTERRKSGDRRSGRDRRISHLQRQAQGALAPTQATLTEADIADLIRLRALSAESRAELRRVIETLDRAERAAAGSPRGRRRAPTAPTAATGR